MISFVKSILGKAGAWVRGKPRVAMPVAPPPRRPLDPIGHNSEAGMNDFYSKPNVLHEIEAPNRTAFYEEVISVLKSHVGDRGGLSVLDVGCGTGHLLRRLRDSFAPSFLAGFDFSEEALKIAKTIVPEAELSRVDIAQPSPGAARYGLVCCTEVLEHMLHPDAAMRNVLGRVDSGGMAIVTVPNGRIDTYAGHINFWSPESWAVWAQGFGEGFAVDTGMLSGGAMFAVFRRRPC